MQHIRIRRERTRNRRALLHAAGYLMRVAVFEAAELDQSEEPPRKLGALAFGHAPSDEMVMQSSPTRGTVGWAYSEKNFTVPQQNCRIQWLHLELSAKSELDQQISGRAYFDNIRIQKSEFNGVAQ